MRTSVAAPTPRILVVDDEANARNALREILADEGYVVDAAADGVAARDRLAAFRPHLVLTDVHMPRMNGIELMRLARATTPPPAVVLMSARLDGEAGAPFVKKPIDVEELLDIVAQALAGRRRR